MHCCFVHCVFVLLWPMLTLVAEAATVDPALSFLTANVNLHGGENTFATGDAENPMKECKACGKMHRQIILMAAAAEAMAAEAMAAEAMAAEAMAAEAMAAGMAAETAESATVDPDGPTCLQLLL